MEQPAIISSLLSIGQELVFYVVMLLFVLYATALAYHWFSYGTSQKSAMLSLTVFLIGSTPLFLIMALTL